MIHKMNETGSEPTEEELINRLALHFLPGIGPVLARNLVSYCGGVEMVFKTSRARLERIPGIGKERAAAIMKNKGKIKAEEEVCYLKKENVRFLFYLDKDYPKRLQHCEDAPVGIFCKGKTDLNPMRSLAIVGTRHMTDHGKEMTMKLIRQLKEYDVTIVSGLAYGIDSVAHREALKNQLPTIGVIANGMKHLYPADHRALAEQMQKNGGLVSEYPSWQKAEVDNFPARNRIVAGLTDGVLVIESAEKGGALITADLANGYNREVMAVPGRITDRYSSGCNQLIRQNKAALITSANDIAELMNWTRAGEEKAQAPVWQPSLFENRPPDEMEILFRLKTGKQAIDELSVTTGIHTAKLSSLLLKMEFDGLVRGLPGKIFELKLA